MNNTERFDKVVMSLLPTIIAGLIFPPLAIVFGIIWLFTFVPSNPDL